MWVVVLGVLAGFALFVAVQAIKLFIPRSRHPAIDRGAGVAIRWLGRIAVLLLVVSAGAVIWIVKFGA